MNKLPILISLLLLASCDGNKETATQAETSQTSTEEQAPEDTTIVKDNFVEEMIAADLYSRTVLSADPDYEFLRRNCTAQFADRLASAYDMDGEGLAVWLLRSGAQDGDGESRVVHVSRLPEDEVHIGDAAIRVDFLDMGNEGSVILCFEDGKIFEAMTPEGTSVFDAM